MPNQRLGADELSAALATQAPVWWPFRTRSRLSWNDEDRRTCRRQLELQRGQPSSLGARARQRHALLPKLLPLLVICAALALSAAWAASPRDALPPSAAAAAPTLTPPDGGAGWNAAHGLPEFPIGVWGSFNDTQANRDLDAAAGINTYVWAADSLFMPEIRSDGRFKVIQDEGLPTNVGSETVGRLLGDEWDMTGESCPDDLNTVKNRLPADGLLRVMNYGKGLALPPGDDPGVNGNWWSGTAEQRLSCERRRPGLGGPVLVHGPMAGRLLLRLPLRRQHHEPAQCRCDGRPASPELVVRGGRRAVGAERPGPEAVDPAGGNSVGGVALGDRGARGILYFQHSFGGACRGDSHVIRSNCEGTRPMVTSIDAQLKRLAPVLNSSTVTSDHGVTGNVRRMVKWDGSHFYVLAGATTGATTMDFSMPCIGIWRHGRQPRRDDGRELDPAQRQRQPSAIRSRTATPSTSTASTEDQTAGCRPVPEEAVRGHLRAGRARRGAHASVVCRGACLWARGVWSSRSDAPPPAPFAAV